jgi:acylphosphatase
VPIELILSGKVQGVACRHYCSRYGRLMGLRGSATNLANGTVRVVLDTEDDETARAYVRALLQNPRQMAFYGFIERIDVRGYDGPISGDYLF